MSDTNQTLLGTTNLLKPLTLNVGTGYSYTINLVDPTNDLHTASDSVSAAFNSNQFSGPYAYLVFLTAGNGALATGYIASAPQTSDQQSSLSGLLASLSIDPSQQGIAEIDQTPTFPVAYTSPASAAGAATSANGSQTYVAITVADVTAGIFGQPAPSPTLNVTLSVDPKTQVPASTIPSNTAIPVSSTATSGAATTPTTNPNTATPVTTPTTATAVTPTAAATPVTPATPTTPATPAIPAAAPIPTATPAANPSVSLGAVDADKTEAATGASTPFVFRATRTGDVSQPLSLSYTVAGSGSAAAPATSFAQSAYPAGTVAFAAAQASAAVVVPVAAGQAITAAQGFTVTLTGPDGTVIAQPTAVGTIEAGFATPVTDAIFGAAHSAYQIIGSGQGFAGTVFDLAAGSTGTQFPGGSANLVFSDGTAVLDPTGNAEEVARIYRLVLGRDADVTGLHAWAGQLDNGSLGLSDVAQAFLGSAEFLGAHPGLSNQALIDFLFQSGLGRTVSAAAGQPFVDLLGAGASRAQVVLGFSDSLENKSATIGTIGDKDVGEVYRLYQAAFGRAPDTAGLAVNTAALDAGATPAQLAQVFTTSAEFLAGSDTAGTVALLSANISGGAIDPALVRSGVTQIGAGGNLGTVLLAFADSAQSRVITTGATHDGYVFLPNS